MGLGGNRMTSFRIGKPVTLSLMLKRNDFPWPGQIVSVRVVDDSGVELLAATVVPETSEPGLYSFGWAGRPTSVSNLVALYTVLDRCYSEDIRIVSEGVTGVSRLKSVITQRTRIKGAIVVDDKEAIVLKGVIKTNRIKAVIAQSKITGSIINKKLTGTIKECN